MFVRLLKLLEIRTEHSLKYEAPSRQGAVQGVSFTISSTTAAKKKILHPPRHAVCRQQLLHQSQRYKKRTVSSQMHSAFHMKCLIVVRL